MNKLTTILAVACLISSTAFGAENYLKKATSIVTTPVEGKQALFTNNILDAALEVPADLSSSVTITATFNEAISFQAINVHGINIYGGILESSSDGTTWAKVADMKISNKNGFASFYEADQIEAKFIRVTLKGSSPRKLPMHLFEMKVYDIDVPENLALWANITETDSTGSNWRFPAFNVVDGNLETNFFPYSMYKGSSFTLDLGSEKAVTSAQIKSRAPLKSIKVFVAKEDRVFKEVASEVAATSKEIEFEEQNARYVRLDITGNTQIGEIIIK